MSEIDKNLYWKTKKGLILITEMNTNHLINAVKVINSMAKTGHDYPECYDNMYIELEERGVDTDFEFSEIFKGLNDV